LKTRKDITCIGCPMGCLVTVELEDGSIGTISGNTCPRGSEYAVKEITSPERIVTSTVMVDGGVFRVAPVKTAGNIPKDKIFDCMALIHDIRLSAPVKAGDIVIENVAGTGVNIVATRAVSEGRKTSN
jgi:CxxC motif-containing protein